MKKNLLSIITLFLVMNAFSQAESFDIATFNPPNGWQRVDSNGMILFHDYRTTNGLNSFCQIFLYPSIQSSGNAQKDFNNAWSLLVAKPTASKARPKTDLSKTDDGWTVVTGYANITFHDLTYTCMLITASGHTKSMSVQVNVVGQDFMPEVQDFLNTYNLDSEKALAKTQPQINSNTNTNTTKTNNTNMNSNASTVSGLDDYEFSMPERWYAQKNASYILLSQYQTTEYGCLVFLFPPQSSSGNLEADAKNFFNQVYPGWQYRYTGAQQGDIARGYTAQGFEYCMIEAAMQKPRPDGYYYDYENGCAIVINLGNQIGVIIGRHQRGEMTCFCKHQYEYWPRFFNSIAIKNVPASQNSNEEIANRLVGAWQSIGGNALNKYIFAGNGQYQFIGAYSTTRYVTPSMVELKTSGFKGDGTYSFTGNQLTIVKDGKATTILFRLEKVNHGNTGWTDRLYILDNYDGKPYEVCYERQQ